MDRERAGASGLAWLTIVGAGILVGPLGGTGCGGSENISDSPTTPDAATNPDAPLDAPDPALCTPRLGDAWAPTWKPPRPPVAGACTEAQLAERYTKCADAITYDAAACTALERDPANARCHQCLMSTEDDTSYGAIIVRSDTSWIPNTPGCIALAARDSTTNGCGARYQAYVACAYASCTPVCSTYHGLIACLRQAKNDTCTRYYDEAACEVDPAYFDCTSHTTAEEFFLAMGRLFCVGDSDGGVGDASVDSGVGDGGPSCDPPNVRCGEDCVDLRVSDDHCGACGYECVDARHCEAGRCSPPWLPLSVTGAPTPRTRHAAGFFDRKYVVLGGATTAQGLGLDSCAAYDVGSDTWSDLAPLHAPRCGHAAASTGTTILAFGGLSNCGDGATTGPGLEIFTPNDVAGAWSVIDAPLAPAPRYDFASTWTGAAFFVYGGGTSGAPAVSSGALFSPSGPAWSDTSCPLAGCERGGAYSAFTDGNVIRVWGGGPFGNAPAGLAYDLAGQSWSAWTVPDGTAEHLAPRFADDGRRIYFLTGSNVVSVYDRKTSGWLANDTSAMPPGFCTDAAAAWSGTELVAWSGDCGTAPVSLGGRYQPAAP